MFFKLASIWMCLAPEGCAPSMLTRLNEMTADNPNFDAAKM